MTVALHSIYFIGIGGIGMSALARWYKALGYQVAGYDKTKSVLTAQLEAENILVHYEDDIALIPESCKTKDILIIYTPAVPKDNSELTYFISQGNKVVKRSEALAIALQGMFVIAVAGTHGKTTTSTMISHVVRECGLNCFAFLGGISQNYHTNLLLGNRNDANKVAVVEADEYDRSFLQLKPNIAVVTSIDPDHLDIYKDETEFTEAFQQFLRAVSSEGFAIVRQDLQLPFSGPAQKETFGIEAGDYKANLHPGTFTFDVVHQNQEEIISDITLQLPGLHNVCNALAAYIVARKLQIPPAKIKSALQSFKGVKRRFEYIVKTDSIIFIDDYAHHPTEIRAILGSVKSLYPSRKLTVIFQPHLYSRTRDFMKAFGESLSLADKLILLEIYPAREQPIAGINSAALLTMTTCPDATVVQKQEVLNYLKNEKMDVLVTIGAGDIDQLVDPIGTFINTQLQEA